MQAPAGVVYFSGEATDPANNGFVEGAYASGQRAATDVIAALRKAAASADQL